MMSAAAAIFFFFSVKRNFVNIISGGGSGSVQRKKMTLKEGKAMSYFRSQAAAVCVLAKFYWIIAS